MNLQLTEEQAALVAAVREILRDHAELPQSQRTSSCHYSEILQQLLQDNGYLGVGREVGALEAALLIVEAARVPVLVEVAASALVVPQVLGTQELAGPVALVAAEQLSRAQRNLPIARHALIDLGDDVAIVPVAADAVESVPSILSYPYGRFRQQPNLSTARRLPMKGATLRHWWRVALAAEMAGAAEAAVAFTLEHVKQRHVFGHPVGAFQSVQHRLVKCHMATTALYHLALRAAWSGNPYDADVAACYAQQNVKRLVVDLHQFCGAMGVTNEFALHLWTYRLRALQAEVGGEVSAALDVARDRWEPPPLREVPQPLSAGAQ
jgi:hypothetical protein